MPNDIVLEPRTEPGRAGLCQFKVRVDPALKRTLAMIAQRDGRTLTDITREALKSEAIRLAGDGLED